MEQFRLASSQAFQLSLGTNGQRLPDRELGEGEESKMRWSKEDLLLWVEDYILTIEIIPPEYQRVEGAEQSSLSGWTQEIMLFHPIILQLYLPYIDWLHSHFRAFSSPCSLPDAVCYLL